MPRPQPPPTPGSSSDIRGKVGTSNAPTFNLPPTAYPEADRASNSSSAPSNNGSDSSYNPVSPGTTAQNPRKRPVQPAMSVITKDDFSLPPPPTRSRKIIQMKPREMEQETTQQSTATSAASKNTGAAPQTGGKKNNSKNTTAAGRKIARKTAHSLIERRRRSKMNEEFSVLKDMIPACQGQDMHKLAILSAGIEYLRYLEQCVTDLQAQNNNSPRPPPPAARPAAEEDFDSDDEMAETQDVEPPRPSSQNQPLPPTHQSTTTQEQQAPLQKTNSIVSLPSLSQMTTNSPSIFSGTASARHYSISSTSQASYSPYIHSNQASPAFGPQLSHIPQYTGPQFGLGSPALQPLDSSSQAHQLRHIAEGASDQLSAEQSRAATPRQGVRSELELDQEATAALLMLNSDRRQWRGMGLAKAGDDRRGSGAGGMSVRDLLSG